MHCYRRSEASVFIPRKKILIKEKIRFEAIEDIPSQFLLKSIRDKFHKKFSKHTSPGFRRKTSRKSSYIYILKGKCKYLVWFLQMLDCIIQLCCSSFKKGIGISFYNNLSKYQSKSAQWLFNETSLKKLNIVLSIIYESTPWGNSELL